MGNLSKVPKVFESRQMKNFHKEKFTADLSQFYWDDLVDFDNSNIAVQMWTKVFVATIDKHAPLKKRKGKNVCAPWITSELIQKQHIRDILKSKAVKLCSDILMEAHKNVRNQVNQLKRGLNREYFTKAMNKAEGNIKNTWQVINKLIDRRSKTTNIPYIEIDGKTVTEPKEKVKELNNYFSRAGENLSKKFNENVTSKTQHLNTVTSQVTSKRFRFWKVTVELVVRAIMQMKTKKSHGPNNISRFILKINCLHRFYSIFTSPFYYCYNILDGFYPLFFFR